MEEEKMSENMTNENNTAVNEIADGAVNVDPQESENTRSGSDSQDYGKSQNNIDQQPADDSQKKPEKKGYGAKGLIRDIIIVAAIVGLLLFFIKPIIVKQTSMLPTLQENNYLFLSRQAYTFGEPERGDIVVFPHQDGEEEELYIKRIIGLPGDVINIKDGKVYVNGKAEDDSYTKDGVTPGSVKDFKVPKGQLYVMGDNRVVSIDSRDPSVGTVKIDDVTGQAIFRLWPFSEIGTVK